MPTSFITFFFLFGRIWYICIALSPFVFFVYYCCVRSKKSSTKEIIIFIRLTDNFTKTLLTLCILVIGSINRFIGSLDINRSSVRLVYFISPICSWLPHITVWHTVFELAYIINFEPIRFCFSDKFYLSSKFQKCSETQYLWISI